MPLPLLSIPPDQDNYTMTDGVEIIGVSTDGGAPRSRNDFIGSTYTITAQWTLNPQDYDTLSSFYYDTLQQGTLPFQTGLYTDSDQITVHTCQFVPDTFGLTSINEQTYVVGATIEATPISPDIATDTSYVGLYSNYLGSSFDFLNQLATLVNVSLVIRM